MELPQALNKKIVELLAGFPGITTEKGLSELLGKAGLEKSLRDSIKVGPIPAFWLPLLIAKLAAHGRLKDGRHALEALLESAKAHEKCGKPKEYEKLLKKVRALAEAHKAEEQTKPKPAAASSTIAHIRLRVKPTSPIDQQTRKKLAASLAQLAELNKQFVQALPPDPDEPTTLLVKLRDDKARELVVHFKSENRKLDTFRRQFGIISITLLDPRQEIAVLSDVKLLPEAQQFTRQFLKKYPKVTDRRNQISPTQIKGLENVLSSDDTTDLLEQYLEHQKLKAIRHENPRFQNKEFHLARFYEQLERKIRDLRTFVREQPHIFPDKNREARYHYQLVKEFLQHLIIDYTFRTQL